MRQRATAVTEEALAAVTPEVGVRYWFSRTYLGAGVSSQAVHDAASRAEHAARAAPDDLNLYLALCHSKRGLKAPLIAADEMSTIA